MLILRRDFVDRRRDSLAGNAPVLLRQEIHGEVDAVEVPAGRIREEIKWPLRANGEQDGVVRTIQALRRHVDANIDVAVKGDTFGFHLANASGDHALFHFEIGNAVNEKSAGASVLLIDMHIMTRPRQLLRGSQPSRTGADNSNFLSGFLVGRLWYDPTFLKAAIGNGALDRFDRDRRVIDVKRAGCFAGCRANASRHFREVIG